MSNRLGLQHNLNNGIIIRACIEAYGQRSDLILMLRTDRNSLSWDHLISVWGIGAKKHRTAPLHLNSTCWKPVYGNTTCLVFRIFAGNWSRTGRHQNKPNKTTFSSVLKLFCICSAVWRLKQQMHRLPLVISGWFPSPPSVTTPCCLSLSNNERVRYALVRIRCGSKRRGKSAPIHTKRQYRLGS